MQRKYPLSVKTVPRVLPRRHRAKASINVRFTSGNNGVHDTNGLRHPHVIVFRFLTLGVKSSSARDRARPNSQQHFTSKGLPAERGYYAYLWNHVQTLRVRQYTFCGISLHAHVAKSSDPFLWWTSLYTRKSSPKSWFFLPPKPVLIHPFSGGKPNTDSALFLWATVSMLLSKNKLGDTKRES